jgi:uncharacterized protein
MSSTPGEQVCDAERIARFRSRRGKVGQELADVTAVLDVKRGTAASLLEGGRRRHHQPRPSPIAVERIHMGQPIVHFEIIGADPPALRSFYGTMFGWEFDTGSLVSDAVSEPSNYGFTSGNTTPDGVGIPGGVGGGKGYDPRARFYVGVADVETALQQAEALGAKRIMGPEQAPTGLVVGHFTDPEGNLIGLAAAGA